MEIPLFTAQDYKEMTSKDRGLAEKLNKAMELEKKGIGFYTGCMNSEKDEEAKELFKTLILQEEQHKRIILKVGSKLV